MSATEWGSGTMFLTFPRGLKRMLWTLVDAYEHGATPNPCIDCNRYLKFDKMFQRMRELEYDYIVTGHYARAGI